MSGEDSPPLARGCWCGNTDLRPYSDHYRLCEQCHTLVSTVRHEHDVSRLRSEADLYGKDYWFGHMERDLGFVNIVQRARIDLTERCPYWLRTLLKYCLPPGRVLELGSAHGGFVALLRWAGFDATGLELSPAIAQIARDSFDIPMLEGPVEDQRLEVGSLDIIALMDVLEHLPDPVRTMRHCVSLLKPNGFLLIQTPQYPEGESFETLTASGHRFVEQFKENEHLYLFSRRSVTRFFAELGCEHVSFEPALFSHYDMFLTASRRLLSPNESDQQAERLMQAPAGRLVQAVLDLSGQLQQSTANYLQANTDREERLLVINDLGTRLAQIDADRAARLDIIGQLQAELAAREAEQLVGRRRIDVLMKRVFGR